MPWKLIMFLFFLLITTLFIGFNLEHTCTISLVFYEFKDVPIYVSLLFAYTAGAITVLPFLFGNSKKRQAKADAAKNAKSAKPGKAAKPGKSKNGMPPDYGID